MLCLQAITETMPTEEPPAMQQQNQMMQMNQAMMAAMFAPRAPPKNPTPAPMDIAQIMAAAQAHVQARQIQQYLSHSKYTKYRDGKKYWP